MVVRYPVHRLVQKLQALAWSDTSAADHVLAHLEAQVDLLLQMGPEPRRDLPVAPGPPRDHWPGEF
jgi:hypothetical protein